ncbi:MAG TPA: NAD(P)-binding domain-containing protein [Acidimicrobiales bacterium]|nr:NAD(P)-binding domain-containing protein [Acidimicrobiales bacterium]
MTTIGIIGAGHVGENIAKAAIANGYDVILSNNQGPDSLAELVKELGSHASAATPEEAAARCDFAVVAIPITTIDQVPVEPLAGKVVIATINYFPDRFGHIAAIDDHSTTAPGLLQRHLPTSKVVRAFSMLDAADMSGDGHPKGDPRRRAIALAGDDSDAKQLVAKLCDQFGFDALDIGGLDESWRVDAGQKAFVTHQDLAQLKENVANAIRN